MDPVLHPACRALSGLLRLLRLNPLHTGGIVASEFTVGPCLSQTLGRRHPFFFFDCHYSLLCVPHQGSSIFAAGWVGIIKFIIVNEFEKNLHYNFPSCQEGSSFVILLRRHQLIIALSIAARRASGSIRRERTGLFMYVHYGERILRRMDRDPMALSIARGLYSRNQKASGLWPV